MSKMTDSVVLVILHRHQDEELGYRVLMSLCQLTDRAIKAAVERLERAGRIEVARPGHGYRHEYRVVTPPSRDECVLAAAHLGEPIP